MQIEKMITATYITETLTGPRGSHVKSHTQQSFI